MFNIFNSFHRPSENTPSIPDIPVMPDMLGSYKEGLPDSCPPKRDMTTDEKSALILKGCALGDCCGLPYEGCSPDQVTDDFKADKPYKCKPKFSDDTIMLCATIDAMHRISEGGFTDIGETNRIFRTFYVKYYKDNPGAEYGMRFLTWANIPLTEDVPERFKTSCGNGSAMRVSAVSVMDDIDDVILAAIVSASCSHAHPEGVKGAVVTALCVWLALNGYSKDDIEHYAEIQYKDYPYSPDKSYKKMKSIHPLKDNPALCQLTVPLSIRCFLDSVDYESAISNAISFGWDTDTQAAITGAIAISFYRGCSSEGDKVFSELQKESCINNLNLQ